MSYAIEAANLGKSFKEHQAVRGIHLQIKKGELYALLGPNGAGKTTTVHMLSTLLQPGSGTARVAGYEVLHNASEVRQRISLTGQFAALDEGLTGRQNLMLVARLYGFSRKQARNLAEQLLDGLSEEDGDRLIRQYSGGMRRWLNIAASIVRCPEVIFLDEPNTGLDPPQPSEGVAVCPKPYTTGHNSDADHTIFGGGRSIS
ncbi:ATP-binding cassette domain-containing protein [Paenibacillus pinihumi]|uniref:ATP-binding cassette domain-containing protein n=1 Tax=Paenibacillus pinihumi TaxID=669462 RepID=UPI0004292DA6|nr:ATP-binding cassette domain-containing protein [Paenibacillus pinihumi]